MLTVGSFNSASARVHSFVVLFGLRGAPIMRDWPVGEAAALSVQCFSMVSLHAAAPQIHSRAGDHPAKQLGKACRVVRLG